MATLIWIVSALTAGTLARMVMKTEGRGFIGDTVLGVLGSVSGAWLLRIVHGEVPPGGIAQGATAFVGAVCVVACGRLVKNVARGAGHLAGESAVTVTSVLPDIEAQIRRLTDLERAVL